MEANRRGQPGGRVVGELDEDLVGLGRAGGHPATAEPARQPRCGGVGLGPQPVPEVVAVEKTGKLNAQKPPLGEQRTALLHVVAEVAPQPVVDQDHGLPAQRPVLGPPDKEGVDPACDDQVQPGSERRQRRREPGAVDVHPEPAGMGVGAESPELLAGVDAAHLGGLSEEDPGRSHAVLILVLGQRLVDEAGVELAGGRGDLHDAVAGGLDGARLVDVDVRRLRGDHPLVGAQEGAEAGEVGLGAAHQQVDLAIPPDLGGDPRGREPRVLVLPVAELLPAVARHEGLEQCRMGTFRVVVEEHQHAAYGRSPRRGRAGLGPRVMAPPGSDHWAGRDPCHTWPVTRGDRLLRLLRGAAGRLRQLRQRAPPRLHVHAAHRQVQDADGDQRREHQAHGAVPPAQRAVGRGRETHPVGE